MAVIWQLSIIHFQEKSLLTGVVLKREPFTYEKKVSRFKHLRKLARSYFVPTYKHKEVTISSNGREIKLTTDRKGGFREVVDFIVSGQLSFQSEDGKQIRLIQSYPVVFENRSNQFEVISDIDDTIMVSNTANVVRRVSTMAFSVPHRRKVIGFTQQLFEYFKKHHARVFYVSKSESNLFSLIGTFIKHNNLPLGALLLTPYLKFRQLTNPKKGRDYKINHIRFLFENSGNKKFILLGDDTQRDMEVYATIAKEYPERIIKIYIRQTKSHISEKKQIQWETLQATGVPSMYFKNEDDAQKEFNLFL